MKRCPATSPGGSTPAGQLPRKGAQCGLEVGHDGEHTVLVPSGMPWSQKIGTLIARSSIGAGLRDIKERGIEAHLKTLDEEMRPRRPRKKHP